MREPAAAPSDRIAEGYRALRDAVAAVDLSGWSALEVRGPDAASFLQGLAAQDLSNPRTPLTAVKTLFLTDKGRAVGLAWVWRRLEDRHVVITDEGAGAALRAHFERFRIMEEVEFAPMAEAPLLGSAGPERDSFVRALAAAIPGAVPLQAEPLSFVLPLTGLHGNVPPSPVEAAAYEGWRLGIGLPRSGLDLDPDRIATELTLPEALSLTKGCYVGQEVVARTASRGHLRRRRVGFRFPWEGEPIPPRTELRAGGETAGYVTSSAREPGAPEGLGMGYLSPDAIHSDVEVLAVQGARTTHLRPSPWPL